MAYFSHTLHQIWDSHEQKPLITISDDGDGLDMVRIVITGDRNTLDLPVEAAELLVKRLREKIGEVKDRSAPQERPPK